MPPFARVERRARSVVDAGLATLEEALAPLRRVLPRARIAGTIAAIWAFAGLLGRRR